MFLLVFCQSSQAFADLLSPWHYIKNYQLGFDVGERRDSAQLGFEIDRNTYYDETCSPVENSRNLVRCVHEFEDDHSGYGIFIEQPFKRRGLWHFDYDISFDLRIVDAKLTPVRQAQIEQKAEKNIPVRDVRLHLYSLVALPYVTLGITPEKWPELLVSLGPTGEMVWGSVNINDTRYQTAERGVFRRSSVSSILSYMQLNLVLRRFGKGYIGLTMSHTQGDDHVQDGEILPETIDNMSNLSLRLNKEFFGVKVLLK
jgi:hypothetical protein